MKTAIVNLGAILTGDWREPVTAGNSIIMSEGKIAHVGTAAASQVVACDVVIDADRAIAIPGLIDSHVHITFGDYTPRQRTVGFLESYVHGGTTTSISASEVHVPGRPKDPEGVKALAVAAMKCFEHYRPGGMRVCAGSMILEPGLVERDFEELARQGVWLAKAGFGAFDTPFEYAPMIAWAKQHGMITTVHTGGSSIPGSTGIWADHLIAMQPHVSFHVNGGPIAMPDRDFPRLVNETNIALQLCTAGNLRTALLDRRAARGCRSIRAAADRDRHADRKRHHAARHALHHLASGEPRRRSRSNGRSRRRPATMPTSIASTAVICGRAAMPTWRSSTPAPAARRTMRSTRCATATSPRWRRS